MLVCLVIVLINENCTRNFLEVADTFGFWQIVSGAEFCQIVDGGRCVTDGEGDYGNNENCEVQALRPLVATATEFNTESGYDQLTVAGTAYDGTTGPQGVALDAGAEMVFTSDGSQTGSGYKVCAAETGSVCVNART